MWCRTGLKLGEQDRAPARLGANLQGAAEEMVSACWRQDLNMPVGPSVSFGSGERASRCDANARPLQKDSSIRSDQPSSTRNHRRPHRARAACLSRDGRGSPVQQKRHRGVRREVPSSTSHNKWIFHGQLVEMVNGENGRTDPSSRQELPSQTLFEQEIRFTVYSRMPVSLDLGWHEK